MHEALSYLSDPESKGKVLVRGWVLDSEQAILLDFIEQKKEYIDRTTKRRNEIAKRTGAALGT